jgi:hypothetical protein
MDWQTRLITLYVFVCDHFRQGLWIHAQRFAPYADLGFTDEEVVTIYLAGILDKQREIRTIHPHAHDYWHDGFLRLPGYGAYVRRLNRGAEVFPVLLERLCPKGEPPTDLGLVDSQPVSWPNNAADSTPRLPARSWRTAGIAPPRSCTTTA